MAMVLPWRHRSHAASEWWRMPWPSHGQWPHCPWPMAQRPCDSWFELRVEVCHGSNGVESDASVSRVSCSCACPKRWPSRVSQRGDHMNGTAGFEKETIAAVMTPRLKKGGPAEFVSDPRRRWPAEEGWRAAAAHGLPEALQGAPRFLDADILEASFVSFAGCAALGEGQGVVNPRSWALPLLPIGLGRATWARGGSTSGAAIGLESSGVLGVPARDVL